MPTVEPIVVVAENNTASQLYIDPRGDDYEGLSLFFMFISSICASADSCLQLLKTLTYFLHYYYFMHLFVLLYISRVSEVSFTPGWHIMNEQ